MALFYIFVLFSARDSAAVQITAVLKPQQGYSKEMKNIRSRRVKVNVIFIVLKEELNSKVK